VQGAGCDVLDLGLDLSVVHFLGEGGGAHGHGDRADRRDENSGLFWVGFGRRTRRRPAPHAARHDDHEQHDQQDGGNGAKAKDQRQVHRRPRDSGSRQGGSQQEEQTASESRDAHDGRKPGPSAHHHHVCLHPGLFSRQ